MIKLHNSSIDHDLQGKDGKVTTIIKGANFACRQARLHPTCVDALRRGLLDEDLHYLPCMHQTMFSKQYFSDTVLRTIADSKAQSRNIRHFGKSVFS